MAKTLKQINAEYYSDCQVVEVVDKTEITKMMESKTSCCWMAGQKIDDGWAVLCQPSRQSLNNKQLVFIARQENIPA